MSSSAIGGHVVLVTFTVHSEHRDAFRARVLRQARDSLELEPQCSVFDVCVDPDRPDLVVLYEVYDDPSAFAVHMASDHYRSFAEEVGPWLAEKQVQQLRRVPA